MYTLKCVDCLIAFHATIIGKPDYEGTKVEITQGWYMVKNLSTVIMDVHATKHPNVFRRPYGISRG